MAMDTTPLQRALLFSSFQRPYVMRSCTPANEILQTFHKVHPSYPAAWSLEMKSLLRKVSTWTRTEFTTPATPHLSPLYSANQNQNTSSRIGRDRPLGMCSGCQSSVICVLGGEGDIGQQMCLWIRSTTHYTKPTLANYPTSKLPTSYQFPR